MKSREEALRSSRGLDPARHQLPPSVPPSKPADVTPSLRSSPITLSSSNVYTTFLSPVLRLPRSAGNNEPAFSALLIGISLGIISFARPRVHHDLTLLFLYLSSTIPPSPRLQDSVALSGIFFALSTPRMPVSLGPSPSSPRSASIRQDAADTARPVGAHQDTVPPTPQVRVNGKPANTSISIPLQPRSSFSSVSPVTPGSDGSGWGANFWVTLADPQVRKCSFSASFKRP